MRAPRRLAAIALVSLACAAGCRACEDTVVRGPVVEGPVRAEFIVRKEAWGKLQRAARRIDGVLVIASDPPVDHLTDCTEPSPELLGDAAGTRFAYRCAPSEPWRLVYVGANGHAWQACRTRGGTGATVDWASVADLEGAAAELAACTGKSAGPLFADLHSRRPALLADVLIASAGDAFGVDPETARDAWWTADKLLPEAEGARVHAALVVQSGREGAPPAVVLRALLLTDAGALAAGPLFDRWKEAVARSEPTAESELLVGLGARTLVKMRPREVGELLCAQIDRVASEVHATTALAASRVPCAPIRAKVACGGGYACGEPGKIHTCSSADLDALLARELDKTPRAAARTTEGWLLPQARLAVAYRAGVVTEAFVRQDERRRYRREPLTPLCGQVERAGDPCDCLEGFDAQERFACDADPEQSEAESFTCTVTFDDAHHVLRARHRCNDAWHCNQDHDCCGGKRCAGGTCVAPSAGPVAPSASPATTPAPSATMAGSSAPR